MEKWQYPENLKTETQKSYVVFETVKEPVVTLQGVISNTTRTINQDNNNNEEGNGSRTQRVVKAVNEVIDRRDEFTDRIIGRNEAGALSGINVNVDYQKLSILDGTGDTASLYLPVSVVFPDGASYENTDLGMAGAAGERALQNGKGAVGSIADVVKQGLSTFYDGITGSQGGAVGSVLVNNLLKSPDLKTTQVLKDNVSLATRVVLNPNSRVLFKDVVFREFAFSFKLIASSKHEADQIEGMIKFFRKELYPETIFTNGSNPSDKGIALGMKYPSRFMIRMMYDGKQVFNKIKPAYLKAVNTTYNQTQQSFHPSSDGSKPKPFEVDLTLSFQESLKLSKDDIKAGF